MSILSAVTGAIKSIGNTIVGGISVIGGLLQDVFGRIIGIPGFILDLLGIRPNKKLRLRFIILMDGAAPVIPQVNIIETLKLTKQILDKQAQIELISAGTLIAGGAPEGALNVTSQSAIFYELWGEVRAYFDALAGIGLFTRTLSVIIVNTMEGDPGFSFGPTANFVLIEKSVFDDPKFSKTLVAHEIGHACGLFIHRKKKENLMHKEGDRGKKLTRWQSSVVRGSKFVWYF